MALSPEQEARYALNHGIDRKDLKPDVQAVYDRLVAEGGPQATPPAADADPLAGITMRTSPEVRERILAMFKKANGKYGKPFDRDRLAWASVFGGNWEEYGQIILQMATLDTLLSIEEKLGEIAAGVQAGKDRQVGP